MSIFNTYARYYDLLYQDKDYEREAAYVDSLIRASSPGASSMLELGCGTGAHAKCFIDKGYTVHGVDQSATMLQQATERVGTERATFSEGYVRTIRVNRKFDAVVSLFHVISYQPTNDDLAASFATAYDHLSDGGVFAFDFWYGPAVLTDRPVVRIKRMEDDRVRVTRIAEPFMHPAENLVDVRYHIFLEDKATGETREIKESHRMRYLFSPELDLLLRQAGFSIVHAAEWLSGSPLSFTTWNGCIVAKR